MENILFSPPDITEEEIKEVVTVLQSGWITTGIKTKKFEQEIAKYCHTKQAVCMNSATACLEAILRIFEIGEGDEVITSAYTYTASASVICHVGAKLILVDTAKDCYEMDYKQIEYAITEKTKAIIAVDLGGVICDYRKIFEIVERKQKVFHANTKLQKLYNRILVIADAAHAFGAKQGNQMCGEIADFTSFSFHAVKNLTTAEGGALTWKEKEGLDKEELYQQFMLYSLHGQSKDALAKTKLGAWEYDVLYPAYKCNMTDIMAAIGLKQLERYETILEKRREIVQQYNKIISQWNRENTLHQIQILNHESNQSSMHLYMIRFRNKTEAYRNQVIEQLANRGIATNVHYKPLPLLTAYQNLGFEINNYNNAYAMYKTELTLPLHTKLTKEQVTYICTMFIEVIQQVKG